MKTRQTETIESKGYIATAADIERLAQAHGNHINASRWQLPSTYLRALIATTQDELGIVRTRRIPEKISDEQVQTQLQVLAKVQEVFYEAVKRGAAKAEMDSEDTRDKSAIVSSRIVFARSAYSTVRNWILRGRFGIEGINPKRAIKRELYEQTPKPERIRTPITGLERQATRMLAVIKKQAATDREGAVEALQSLITTLSHGFDELGLPASELRDTVDTTATQVVQEALGRIAARPRGRPPNGRPAPAGAQA